MGYCILFAAILLMPTVVVLAEGPVTDPKNVEAQQTVAPSIFEELEKIEKEKKPLTAEEILKAQRATPARGPKWLPGFLQKDFIFRKEAYLLGRYSDEQGTAEGRNSLGWEAYKIFSDQYGNLLDFDWQFRFTRTDNTLEGMPLNNIQAAEAENKPWEVETHNLYVNLYNPFNRLTSDTDTQSWLLGKFNFRIGRYYMPLGLNWFTDTHGTVWQLSNARNLGFERDWGVDTFGGIGQDLFYVLGYRAGSGSPIEFDMDGQRGYAVGRLGTSPKWQRLKNLETGLSFMAGERLDPMAVERSPSVKARANKDIVDGFRVGGDVRYVFRQFKFTSEVTGGKDEEDELATLLFQTEYIDPGQRWEVLGQLRNFYQAIENHEGDDTDTSLILEFDWFLWNEPSKIHSFRFNYEHQFFRIEGKADDLFTLSYYIYF